MELPLERLEQKFRADLNPYWKVYQGRSTKARLLAKNDSVENIDESWEILYDELSLYPSGLVTVVTTKSPNANNHYSYSVAWGEQNDFRGQRNTGRTNRNGAFGDFMQMFGFMQQFQHGAMQENQNLWKQQLEQQYENRRLQEENEALAATPTNEWIAGFKELAPTLQGFFAPKQPQPTAIGTAGTTTVKKEETTQAQPTQNTHRFSLDKAAHDLMNLQKLIPNYPVNDVIHKIVAYGNKDEANKSNLMMILNQVMSDEA